MLYFEDFAAGMTVDCGARAISEAELLAFAERYDPQPMHLDPDAAEVSMLRGLAASGWHTCAMGQRIFTDGFLRRVAALGSPGVAETRWRRPVRPDRPIRGQFETVGVRPSRSRPEIGLVSIAYTLSQDNEPVCLERFTFIVASRHASEFDGAFGRAQEPGAATAPRPPAAAVEPPWRDTVGVEELVWGSIDDIAIGRGVDLGCEEITAEDIVEFGRAFDPQPFHLDAAAGRASLFGGLAASGWQLTALWSRRMQAGIRGALAGQPASRRAAVGGLFGPSPGFFDLEWKRPALAGDRLRFFTQPQEVVPYETRPDWALLRTLNGAVDQNGALVFRFVGQVMVRR